MKYKELMETIIGCVYSLYNKMGFGFIECVYERCFLIELRKADMVMETQKLIIVYYKVEIVGEFVATVIVNDAIILKLNSVSRIVKTHEPQLFNYLVATGKPVRLIINS